MSIFTDRKVRPATEEEVNHAVTGRRTRRTRPGEVERHIARQRKNRRRDGIREIMRENPGITRRRASKLYDSTH